MRRNTKWLIGLGVIVVLFVGIFGISKFASGGSANNKVKTVTIGVAPGPYGEMATNVIGPLLKDKGFQVKTKEFNDYVQPNKALNSGEIDANLFQHTAYLKTFSKANHLKLTAIGKTPTLGWGSILRRLNQLMI